MSAGSYGGLSEVQPDLKFNKGRRLKGLDEFEKPEFVGRMDRVARRRKLEWWGLMLGGAAVGGAIGWFLI